jgi:hypothetical protein
MRTVEEVRAQHYPFVPFAVTPAGTEYCWTCRDKWPCDTGIALAATTSAPPAPGGCVFVLQAIEDGGLIELHGVFTELDRAKHHLEPKYPNLSAWEETTYRHAHGGPEMRAWRAHTGKHPVLIEETTLDGTPAPGGEAERVRVLETGIGRAVKALGALEHTRWTTQSLMSLKHEVRLVCAGLKDALDARPAVPEYPIPQGQAECPVCGTLCWVKGDPSEGTCSYEPAVPGPIPGGESEQAITDSIRVMREAADVLGTLGQATYAVHLRDRALWLESILTPAPAATSEDGE